jgi:type II secretory pathway pseudopilin PulG
MNSSHSSDRRGITLMEVLISLGILSVGLASVVSLIPAGASQAKLSIIEDRRAALGYAALSDAIVRGILNPRRWNAFPATPYAIAIDPLGQDIAGVTRFPAGVTLVELAGIAAGSAAAETVFRSSDDLVYDTSQSEDDPAIPVYFPGTSRRMSNGDFSWLATLVPETPTAPNQYYRLSAVCFYKRAIPPDVSNTHFTGTQSDASTFSFSCTLSDDEFRSLFPRGTAVFMSTAGQPPVWRHVVMASPTRTAGTVTAVELMFDRPIPGAAATNLYAFQGAIGVTEKVVTLEGDSPWSQ